MSELTNRMDRPVLDSLGEKFIVSSSGSSFFQVVRLLRSRWWLVAVCAMVGGLIALVASLLQTPVFESTATLYVTSGSDSNAQSAYQGSLASQQRVASYTRLARSDAVVSEALQRSGLDLSVDDAKGQISAVATPGTVLMTVAVKDPDQNRATRLVNAVADSLTNYVSVLERPKAGSDPLAKLTVVTPGTSTVGAVSPKTKVNVGIGLLVGLLIGALLVFVRDRLDSTIRSSEDLVSFQSMPVLAGVPFHSSLEKDHRLDFSAGSSPPAEEYRKLRTGLVYANVDRPSHVILVTSPSENEGKTTTAVNLAAALGEAGDSVLLIDMDLRKPAASKMLGASDNVGVTDYLCGRVELADALQFDSSRSFTFLSAGQLPPNPAELIGSQRCRTLMSMVAEQFDYVIVDSPPVLPVTDAAVASQWVDGVLLVVRVDQTKRNAVGSALDNLSMVGANILGCVLNGVNPDRGYAQYSNYSYNSYSQPDV